MEALLQQAASEMPAAVSLWRDPPGWLREQDLGREFWIFFAAAFFFDAGFSIYFFLFNLFLLDFDFHERAIGLVGGALTLGSVAGTLPAGLLVRKLGLRPLLIFCFLAAPLLNALRTLWMWQDAQIGLAFLAGVAMAAWGVCFLPAVARLTSDKNRASAFGLIFSVSVGTSALGGALCGYLPQWFASAGIPMQAAEVKRLILLASCGVALMGVLAVFRLRVPPADQTMEQIPRLERSWSRALRPAPILLRFLPLMALWAAVLAAFTPFANVYLARYLHIPLTRIGLIFSTAQVAQLCLGLMTPLVFRRLGLSNGIAVTQLAAALALALLAAVSDGRLAVVLYLGFSAAQWMSSPGLYNLLMTETPDKERSTAAALTLFCNALAGSAATAGAGILFSRFGYPSVLLGISFLAAAVALLFRYFVRPQAARLTELATAVGNPGGAERRRAE